MSNRPPIVTRLFGVVVDDGPLLAENLLTGASDPDHDPLRIVNLAATVTTADGRVLIAGADYTLQGSSFALTAAGLAKFKSLGFGQFDQIIVSFGVTDGKATTANTLSLTVVGWNEPPTTSDVTITTPQNGAYGVQACRFSLRRRG